MKKILKFFAGKKTIIVTCIMIIIGYLYGKQIIGDLEYSMLSGLIGAVFGTASVLTNMKFDTVKKQTPMEVISEELKK